MRDTLKRIGPALSLFVAVLGVLLTSAQVAHAQTLTTLHQFTGGADGTFPEGGLVFDSQGNLYGITIFGGARSGGTLFKLTPSSNETVVHSFDSGLIPSVCHQPTQGGPLRDGALPEPGLAIDSQGSLYGTTRRGGLCGLGTVFKVSSTGTETVLYRFTGAADGAYPNPGLISDSQGNLYGTSQGGLGQFCCGTVFEVTASGTKKTLYTFTNGADGGLPLAGLVRDSNGNLYGTTIGGGTNGFGTAFKLAPNGTETVLFSFQQSDSPVSGLALDGQGNLYGVTGNAHNGGTGGGSIFKLTASGTKTVVYSFSGADGDGPSGVILDQQGNLYGTTSNGGVGGCAPVGCGVVFQVTSNGTETVLYDFTGGADGADPFGVLRLDAQGNLYGTTVSGGNFGSGCTSGCGTVFKVTK